MVHSPYDFPIPDELSDVVHRHQRHISELVLKLQSIGMKDELIEQSVNQLIAAYRTQLLEAIKALGGLCRA
jgi:hypothetical protein